jgi:Mce-associated membrane protein
MNDISTDQLEGRNGVATATTTTTLVADDMDDEVDAVADTGELENTADLEDNDTTDTDEGTATATEVEDAGGVPKWRALQRMSPTRYAIAVGSALVVVLAALLGWSQYHLVQAQHAQAHRALFLQVAKQGALNLTTIDWQNADADVHRILDVATGEFYDDFAKRSQPFIDALKQAKAKTVGTITEAGLESENPDSARALVALSVQTSSSDENAQGPREWRMRIDVQKVGDQVKVSNVGFVP